MVKFAQSLTLERKWAKMMMQVTFQLMVMKCHLKRAFDQQLDLIDLTRGGGDDGPFVESKLVVIAYFALSMILWTIDSSDFAERVDASLLAFDLSVALNLIVTVAAVVVVAAVAVVVVVAIAFGKIAPSSATSTERE